MQRTCGLGPVQRTVLHVPAACPHQQQQTRHTQRLTPAAAVAVLTPAAAGY